LLDEPTNHLDLEAQRWFDNYLKRDHGTVLFISHDLAFLNNVARTIISIEYNEWHSPFELMEALWKWIKDYNQSYLHSSLGYKSPVKFEEEYHNTTLQRKLSIPLT
jgi:ATPase subunit of ABC transporter with duplicated ATPase domains